jgi:hypothetical protein
MSRSNTLRSRVSRETRQLLVAALVALVALWMLARIRFPGQPPTPNPIPSLLSQLSVAPRFANLAGEIAELQERLSSSWLAIPVSGVDEFVEEGARHLPAIRLNSGAAVVLLRSGDRIGNEQDILALDRVTGLAVIRAAGNLGNNAAEISQWVPPALDTPRYLMATVGTAAGVSLRPVLVGSLHESRSPAWSGPIWSVPDGTDLGASSFVFTTSGEMAGLVVREPAGLAIIPWDIVTAEAARILDRGRAQASDMRIEVRPLTPALARATGADSGVVVAWVDSRGPAGGQVAVGDVIEAINERRIAHTRDWEVASSRLPAGDATLRVRRRGGTLTFKLSLPVMTPSEASASLGLRMRDVPGLGATVVRVEPRSAGSLARLQEGDIITFAGDITAPTATQIDDAFRTVRTGEAIMLAITRGRTHLVVGLVK